MIWAMIIMPFMGRLIDTKPILWLPILMIIIYGSMVLENKFVLASYSNYWTQALFNCLLETPLMLLGYVFARLKIYERVKVPAKWITILVAIVVAAIILLARAYTRGPAGVIAELIYAPGIILCILAIFTAKPLKCISKVMQELGDKSVYMWFFHSIFFTAATRPTYQHFVLISDNLWIITIWTIILSYVCSCIIKKIVDI